MFGGERTSVSFLRCVTLYSVADGGRVGRISGLAFRCGVRPTIFDLGDGLMGSTTYPGGALVEHAQKVLDRHAVSSGDGLCVTCRVLGPCAEHVAAARVFVLSARLPQRRPGATRPELVPAKRTDFRWLA
jgi:hypothetical protein